MAACKQCPYPLYVRMALDETRTWQSSTPIEECVLQPDIQSLIDHLFETLEKNHGKEFISAALGYITVAYRGAWRFVALIKGVKRRRIMN